MAQTPAFPYALVKASLRVVPYVRGRLVFAMIVARALHERPFDKILIDLPSFMNQRRWLDAPLEAFPLVSSLLFAADDGNCSLYPLVPTDAACAAAWLAKNRSLAFECVDPVIFHVPGDGICPAGAPSPGDERLALKNLELYFEDAWLEMDAVGREAPPDSMKSFLAHGECVADRILDRAGSDGETLLVCEYRLWWAVRRALSAGNRAERQPAPSRRRAIPCALLLEDPYLLWAAGLFDDYLSINRRFCESLESGKAAFFEKHGMMADLAAECFTRVPAARATPYSTDSLEALVRCSPDDAELGPSDLGQLAQLLFDYPVPATGDVARHPPEYFKVVEDKIVSTDKCFDLPDVYHTRPYGEPLATDSGRAPMASGYLPRARWLQHIHPVITRQEMKSLGERTSDSRWAVARDFELHTQAAALVREAADGAGHAELEGEEMDTYTPVVFIFCSDPGEPWKLTLVHNNNIPWQALLRRKERLEPLDNLPEQDSVYSLLATTQSLEPVFERHIEREHLTSLTLLYSGDGMGVRRYEAIMRQPKMYQCRTGPREDKDLKDFKSHDLGLAWALKYARKNVLAVARRGWEPCEAIKGFAARKSKRILMVPLDVLPAGLVERIGRLHFMSNALKAHPECDRIIARFVQ